MVHRLPPELSTNFVDGFEVPVSVSFYKYINALRGTPQHARVSLELPYETLYPFEEHLDCDCCQEQAHQPFQRRQSASAYELGYAVREEQQ